MFSECAKISSSKITVSGRGEERRCGWGWGWRVEGNSAIISHDKQDPFEVNTKAGFVFSPDALCEDGNTIKTKPSPVHLPRHINRLNKPPQTKNIKRQYRVWQDRYELF